ncbi:hypothetical protein SDC9_56392 [bioreactor metagenome]|uniref:Uncharacterized protein n=1 Tax=bioreactor metagenome TaxID=1076179 RepID=A0A644X2R0_9ZZZZ
MNERTILNVEHVQLELVLKIRVVFSVDLGVARQARLDLHSITELRHALAIEVDVFNPLRARADQRHFAV